MNSLKKGEGVPLLNFEGGPRILLLNFELLLLLSLYLKLTELQNTSKIQLK